eukprot:SAG31_NODE_1871_length_7025_cov_10.081144_5_plen_67_part_00
MRQRLGLWALTTLHFFVTVAAFQAVQHSVDFIGADYERWVFVLTASDSSSAAATGFVTADNRFTSS